MLLIGDIHINSTYKDKILTALRNFIASQPKETNLIFLGDFVYHFSYDRNALLALYDFFLDLYQQGKSLYILAGNHDRLGNSFVFEEAKKAFQLLQVVNREQANKIHFITTPLLTELEGKTICFLPYMLDINLANYSGIEQLQDPFYYEQLTTGNKHQILSAKLHLLVQYFKNHAPQLTIIHHYYVDGIAFPGQTSKFSFRDGALSSQRLEDPNLQFISGHLHQAFQYKNYLCTGSIWATSPLEENQLKGCFSLSEQGYTFYEISIASYFSIEYEEHASSLFETVKKSLTLADIHAHYETLKKDLQQHHNGTGNHIHYQFLPTLDLKTITLSLRVETLNYQNIDEFIAPALQHQLFDIKLKKKLPAVDDLLEKLQKPDTSVLQQGFGGRIDLLKRFLRKQYPDHYQEYEALLHHLKLV
ncbi:MAG: metallophosphoesterase [Candidatus Peribacteria bacterium]|jgi:DNA repair exonuclease SbcCD nuclease subunit|nr:metallophosphoesterase [Candidatus Peribacteria bacterium]